MDFLSKMGAEDLDQPGLRGGNLARHENTSQIQLHLETDIDIGAVVGLHHNVNRRFRTWFRPDHRALVSFLYLMDSSNQDASSQRRPVDNNHYKDCRRTK